MSSEESSRSRFAAQIEQQAATARACLERIRSGESAGLTEMKQFWHQMKRAGASTGVPAVTVLGSALEALCDIWQRARAAGREHPDSAHLMKEALDLLPALAAGGMPRGSGNLKQLCARADELRQSLLQNLATREEI